MRMDHDLGRIDLISWQGRKNRRIKSGVNVWTVIVVACAVLGGVSITAQATGWLQWTGLLAVVPAGLVLLAVGAQLVAVVRATLIWLAG
jgi:hypothetical protein